MKFSNVPIVMFLGCMIFPVARALPPTQLGDSFVTLDYQTYPGFITDEAHDTELFYLAPDGTCKQLYARTEALGFVSYSPTLTGTYTYVPTVGNPNEATLNISFPSARQYYGGKLEFSGDTEGSVNLGTNTIGAESFSILVASPNSYLVNVSNRVTIRPSETAITGFVIGGSASRLVLVRAVGPGLVQFGVNPASASPEMSLYSGANVTASAQPWGSVTGYDTQAMSWIFNLVGAFPLQSGSGDVVFFGTLSPGAYTALAVDPSAPATGASALIEVYILPYSG